LADALVYLGNGVYNFDFNRSQVVCATAFTFDIDFAEVFDQRDDDLIDSGLATFTTS
jgi:hypothetical protein